MLTKNNSDSEYYGRDLVTDVTFVMFVTCGQNIIVILNIMGEIL